MKVDLARSVPFSRRITHEDQACGMQQSIRIECPPFEITLSHWDRLFPPTHSKRILCFALPPKTDKATTVRRLHVAFHYTVQRVPFLAGTIVPLSEQEGGRPWLRKVVPKGAARLDVRDLSHELSFSELRAMNFHQKLLKADKLCTFNRVAYVTEDPVDVCCFNATFIDGGLLLAVGIIHIVADGRGVSDIIKIFADNLKKSQSGKIGFPLITTKEVYKSNRMALVDGHDHHGDIENHRAWTASPFNCHTFILDVEHSCQTFRISASSLRLLKKLASIHLPTGEWISTSDALAALIWRSIMIARNRAGILSDNATVSLAQPVDFRSHLKIPEPYFGNCLYVTAATMPFAAVAHPRTGLSVAAAIVRADVKAVTADKVRDLLAFAERESGRYHTRLRVIEDLPTSSIILTSHLRFDLHGLDFGPMVEGGRIQALRFPEKGTMAGAVIVMPLCKDGSVDFMITEPERTIRCLVEDALFARFTGGRIL